MPKKETVIIEDPRSVLGPENFGDFKIDWCREHLGIGENGLFKRNGIEYRVIIVPNNAVKNEREKEKLVSRMLRKFGK